MERKIITYGRAKELGIWSEVCKREGWNEKRIERYLHEEMIFYVDADLIIED